MMIFKLLLIIHIFSGSLALITGYISLFSKKGGRIHVKSGRIYMWGMISIVVTAFPMSIIHPNPFLFCIAIFAGYLTYVGIRSIIKKSSANSQLDIWVSGIMFSTCLLAYVGILILPYGKTIPIDFRIIAMVFATIALLLSTIELWGSKIFWGTKNYIAKHETFITSALISTTTAVLATMQPKLGISVLVAWLGPTVIGTPVIVYYLFKYYRR